MLYSTMKIQETANKDLNNAFSGGFLFLEKKPTVHNVTFLKMMLKRQKYIHISYVMSGAYYVKLTHSLNIH